MQKQFGYDQQNNKEEKYQQSLVNKESDFVSEK